MTERHAFLSAIRESPDDDTPRLVYADWLEEHGEPERAELVRAGLLRGDLLRMCQPMYPDCAVVMQERRGVVEWVTLPWEIWREYGDEIWEKELPWRVRLTTWPGGSDFKFMGEDIRALWPGIDFELPGVTAADVEAVIAQRANA